MYSFKTHLLVLAALVLAACGGGSSIDYDLPSAELPQAASFRHTALPANLDRGMTFVDHALCNGNPGAVLLVTATWVPGGGGLGVYINHNLGVEFDAGRGQWAIVYLDGDDVPSGAAFHVTVANGADVGGTQFFTHVAAGGGAHPIGTYLDHATLNGNEHRNVLVTANVTPSGGARVVHDRSLGVAYVAGEGRWVIYNRQSVPMPAGAAFNVAVVSTAAASPFGLAGVHEAIPANCHAGNTWLTLPNDPDLVVHATVVYHDGDPGYARIFGVANPSGSGWAIFNENATAVTAGPHWNVAVAR